MSNLDICLSNIDIRMSNMFVMNEHVGQTYVQTGQPCVQIKMKISLKYQYWQKPISFIGWWHLGTITYIKLEFLAQFFFQIFHKLWFLLDTRVSKLDIRLSKLDTRLSNLDTRLSTSGLLVLLDPLRFFEGGRNVLTPLIEFFQFLRRLMQKMRFYIT